VTDPVAEAESRLQHLLGLPAALAKRAVVETLDCFVTSVDDYVQARHRELQAQGVTNPEIFERIADELPRLRFAAPALSARQLRRRVYG
jgi:hypothetical protein